MRRLRAILMAEVIASLLASPLPALLALALVLALPLAPVAHAQAARSPKRAPAAIPGEIIVKLRGDASAASSSALSSAAEAPRSTGALASKLAREIGARWLSELKVDRAAGGHHRLRVGAGQTVEATLRRLRADPRVEYAEPNYVYRASALPSDTHFGELWGIRNTGQSVQDLAVSFSKPRTATAVSGKDIGLETAWDTVTDCSGVIVAVVDTGFNYEHEDLAGNLWNGNAGHGVDFVDDDEDPMDLNGHGTHVAGTIGARGDNGVGVAGVCWRATIMGVRVLDAAGNGSLGDVASGIRWAADHGARVINLSLGGSQSETMKSAIAYARDLGVVVVAAAGNESSNNDDFGTYPCAFELPNVVCVAALNPDFSLAGYSNYGRTSVDIGAPGTNILSLWPGPAAQLAETFAPADWGLGVLPPLDKTDSWYPMTHAGKTNLACSSDWGGGSTYARDLDAKVWRNYAFTPDSNGRLPGGHKLYFKAELDTEEGYDRFSVAYAPENTMPWSSTSRVEIISESGNGFITATEELDGCAGKANCSIGFRLTSDDESIEGMGARVYDMELRSWTRGTTGYTVSSGTSMATPHVSGVAAMLMTAQPLYDWRDVVAVLKESGTSVDALADKTSTGRALHAPSALGHIKTPSGIGASEI